MKSVPPRGSGWVSELAIVDFRLQISFGGNQEWQLAIGNQSTHPLPRGGTDLISLARRVCGLAQEEPNLGLTDSDAPLQVFPTRIAMQRFHQRFKF
jgi:hypothetical protein